MIFSACPAPILDHKTIVLGHGSGGKLSHELIQKLIVPAFRNPILETQHDGAVLSMGGARVAFSADSYVVDPIFFPGGNIGDLAVNGTVNDLAMCGARPQYLSASFIIEEGLALDDFWRMLCSMKEAADHAGVAFVTGDTKVIDRGKADKIFVNTSGIGIIPEGITIDPSLAKPGDAIIVNGPVGSHGMAIMSVREGLEFETPIESDTAALNGLVEAILAASGAVHVLRDPTRGGVASALNEIAEKSGYGIAIAEASIPICSEVQGACEILGLDPLYVANEGRLLVFVDPKDTEIVLAAMRAHALGRQSAIIGEVVGDHGGLVVMKDANRRKPDRGHAVGRTTTEDLLMMETSNIAVLGLGFLLGLKHATDPDHIVAVTTFLGDERQLRRACKIGAFWGLGHAIALSVAGLVVIGLKIPMSKWLADRLELAVAAMLIVLGARLMARVHSHWHKHHHDFPTYRWGLRPLFVGVVHGTAGSAALTLLVLSTISSTVSGLLYILIFGIGSMLGMLVISLTLALPIQLAGERINSLIRPIQIGTGFVSCAFGVYLAVGICLHLLQ